MWSSPEFRGGGLYDCANSLVVDVDSTLVSCRNVIHEFDIPTKNRTAYGTTMDDMGG